MVNTCGICEGRISNHTYSIKCFFCSHMFHRNCLPLISKDDLIALKSTGIWSCTRCNADIFPFNHIEEQEDFIDVISESWFVNGTYSLSDLDKRLFTPFEIDSAHEDSVNSEYDPDVIFFHELRISTGTSKYFNDETLNSVLADSNLTSTNPMSLLSLNIRSIPKNIDKLSSYLNMLNISFSFIGITETWFNDDNISLFGLPDYAHESVHRSSRRGGGVSLFVMNTIPYIVRNDLSNFDSLAETVFIEVDKSVFQTEKNLIIGVLYRIPNKDMKLFNEKFNDLLSSVKEEKKIGYFLGDYNINILNTDSHPPTSDFVDICFSNSFLPLINKPTRVTKYSATIIDNIITNDILNISHIQGLLLSDISDHFPVFLIYKELSSKNVKVEVKKRVLTAKSMSSFRDALQNTSFQDVLDSKDAQIATSAFYNQLRSLYDKYFPIKTLTKKYSCKKPWLSDGLKQSIRNKNKLYKKILKYPSDDNTKNYKIYRNKLHHLLRSAERQYYQDLLQNNKNNMKKSWSIMKNIINKKKSSTIPQYFMHNNRKIIDQVEISTHFNDFFTNVGTSLSDKIPQPKHSAISYLQSNYSKSIFLKPATQNEVLILIKDLKTDSSCGWDDISPKVVKFSHLFLIDPLVHLINLSLSQGIFPSELKIAKVIPLFKGGDATFFNNYRPISVLSILSKLFERVYYNRLIHFLNQEKILYDKQFGFRKKHSTELALILVLDQISNALDSGDYVLGVYLDFSKAFDTVNHSILLQKLQHYGIRGIAYEWVKSYLDNRKQFVSFSGYKSPLNIINCGVPQGSILGPLLFLLYINDLPSIAKNLFMCMFADDTNVFLTGKNLINLEKTMNDELSLMSDWLVSNRLSLNINKTHFMIFCPPRKKPDYSVKLKIENDNIDKVTHTKFLGVILDSQLSWKLHVKYIKGKVCKSIGIIYRAKHFLNRDSLICLYHAFLYPYLVYCVSIWGGSNVTTLSPIIKVQKRAVRCIMSASKYSSTALFFKELHILHFQQIYKLQILLFVYRYKMSLLPHVFKDFYIRNSDVHNYRTRQLLNFYPPRCRSELTKAGAKYRGCILWNSLSPDSKALNVSISLFKKLILRTFSLS